MQEPVRSGVSEFLGVALTGFNWHRGLRVGCGSELELSWGLRGMGGNSMVAWEGSGNAETKPEKPGQAGLD